MSSEVLGVSALLARFAKMAVLGEQAAVLTQSTLADDVAERARTMAPVDTGALRESITSDGGVVSAGVDYAGFVEYGTSDTPPEPFMRPAADTVSTSRALGVGSQVLRRA